MKRNIITLAITTLMLSSCGIYTKYQPTTTVPEELLGQRKRFLIQFIILPS